MTAIAGTITRRTTVTVVAASSGDGDLVAALFNGLVFNSVSTSACTATNSSGTVTIYWPQTTCRMGNGLVLDFVSGIVAADTTLAQTPLITVNTQVAIT